PGGYVGARRGSRQPVPPTTGRYQSRCCRSFSLLAFRGGDDCTAKNWMRALLGSRMHDVHDVHAAAVHARVSAEGGNAAGKAQLALAVVQKCLTRGEAAEEPGLLPVRVHDNAGALEAGPRVKDIG